MVNVYLANLYLTRAIRMTGKPDFLHVFVSWQLSISQGPKLLNGKSYNHQYQTWPQFSHQ